MKEAGNWLTATNVRDHLVGLGFDFSGYSTNPLASVSTTLRRMKPEEVETTTVDGGVTAYQWKQQSTLSGRIDQTAKAEVIRKARVSRAFGLPPPPKFHDAIEESLSNVLKKK
jgi:hypothetical protein